MAIQFIANYSSPGLPEYSSLQFEVSIETEIGNTSELDFAAERLNSSLLSAVDAQIRQVGFVPAASWCIRRSAFCHAADSTVSCASVFKSPDISFRRTGMELFGKAEAVHPAAGA